jgi:peptidoglycan hydrolase-like protein with peptidoglycan-binding domain
LRWLRSFRSSPSRPQAPNSQSVSSTSTRFRDSTLTAFAGYKPCCGEGFESGKIDGVPGPITKAAVGAFQAKYGMRVSGEMDNQFLLGLGAVDLAGANE